MTTTYNYVSSQHNFMGKIVKKLRKFHFNGIFLPQGRYQAFFKYFRRGKKMGNSSNLRGKVGFPVKFFKAVIVSSCSEGKMVLELRVHFILKLGTT